VTRPEFARSFERIPEPWRKRLGLALLIAAAILFPVVHNNDADIDSMANASAYAVLALGLNIVVGFAGLLIWVTRRSSRSVPTLTAS